MLEKYDDHTNALLLAACCLRARRFLLPVCHSNQVKKRDEYSVKLKKVKLLSGTRVETSIVSS